MHTYRSTRTNLSKTLAFLFLMGSSFGFGQTLREQPSGDTSQILNKNQWLEDLDQLYGLIQAEHRNPYHTHSPAEFERLYRQLRGAIPEQNNWEVMAGLCRLAAYVGDGHTRLTLPLASGLGLNQAHTKTPLPADSSMVFRHLPVSFYWFDDGLFIWEATKEYRNLIGARVVEVQGTPSMEALEAIRPYAHYENEFGYRLIAPARLSYFELLRSQGLAGENEVKLRLATGQSEWETTLAPLPPFTDAPFYSHPTAKMEPTPLSRIKNDLNYWYSVERDSVLYVQINEMMSHESGMNFMAFMGVLDQVIAREPIRRLILDLRNNFGGDNSYAIPVVNLFLKNPFLNEIGSSYTLIGRKTFSAAQYLCNDLEKWSNTIFIGEPTGASPSHYGDSRKFQLKHSNLTVRLSSVYWRHWNSNESIKEFQPSIPTANNAKDFFNSWDRPLETAMDFKIGPNFLAGYKKLYQLGGIETAKRFYLRKVWDWTTPPSTISAMEKVLLGWMQDQP